MEQKEQSFEEKLALADKILNDLNKDDVSLENSIKLHEQGKKLLNEANLRPSATNAAFKRGEA